MRTESLKVEGERAVKIFRLAVERAGLGNVIAQNPLGSELVIAIHSSTGSGNLGRYARGLGGRAERWPSEDLSASRRLAKDGVECLEEEILSLIRYEGGYGKLDQLISPNPHPSQPQDPPAWETLPQD